MCCYNRFRHTFITIRLLTQAFMYKKYCLSTCHHSAPCMLNFHGRRAKWQGLCLYVNIYNMYYKKMRKNVLDFVVFYQNIFNVNDTVTAASVWHEQWNASIFISCIITHHCLIRMSQSECRRVYKLQLTQRYSVMHVQYIYPHMLVA